MKTSYMIGLNLVLLAIIGGIFFYKPHVPQNIPNNNSAIRIENGIQYVTISAYNGYTPAQVTAAANMQTILEMSTNNTYDCSSSLVLRSENYKNILPATGITNIPLGVKKSGENMVGLCSMGMYSFTINFI